jgi:hypothetical protein
MVMYSFVFPRKLNGETEVTKMLVGGRPEVREFNFQNGHRTR